MPGIVSLIALGLYYAIPALPSYMFGEDYSFKERFFLRLYLLLKQLFHALVFDFGYFSYYKFFYGQVLHSLAFQPPYFSFPSHTWASLDNQAWGAYTGKLGGAY